MTNWAHKLREAQELHDVGVVTAEEFGRIRAGCLRRLEEDAGGLDGAAGLEGGVGLEGGGGLEGEGVPDRGQDESEGGAANHGGPIADSAFLDNIDFGVPIFLTLLFNMSEGVMACRIRVMEVVRRGVRRGVIFPFKKLDYGAIFGVSGTRIWVSRRCPGVPYAGSRPPRGAPLPC